MVNDCHIFFSFEDPGLQIGFEYGSFDETESHKIVNEIAENITKATGQGARVIQIT